MPALRRIRVEAKHSRISGTSIYLTELGYMKLSQISTGLLINFNVQRLTDGIQRFKL